MQKTIIVDDMDGSYNATPVTFGFNKKTYELDLSSKNLKALEKALDPFISAASKGTVKAPARRKRAIKEIKEVKEVKDTTSPAFRRLAREHGIKNGMKIGARGRVPAAVLDSYSASIAAELAQIDK